MPKSKQVSVIMCAGCGAVLTPKNTHYDDKARMLCLECYNAWFEAAFCEECGHRWNECTCQNYEYEGYEDIGDLYDNEDEESYEVDDYD